MNRKRRMRYELGQKWDATVLEVRYKKIDHA